jgi:hypothetical protein
VPLHTGPLHGGRHAARLSAHALHLGRLTPPDRTLPPHARRACLRTRSEGRSTPGTPLPPDRIAPIRRAG